MTVTRTVQEAFIARAARAARATAKEYGVPAAVTLAQAALESDWGRAHMGEANNYFGIKAYDKGGVPQIGPIAKGFVTLPTREVVNGRSITVNARFRSYASMADSFRDHANFLKVNSRYAPAFAHTGDPDAFARAIAKAGYATDPLVRRQADRADAAVQALRLRQADGEARRGRRRGPRARAQGADTAARAGRRAPGLAQRAPAPARGAAPARRRRPLGPADRDRLRRRVPRAGDRRRAARADLPDHRGHLRDPHAGRAGPRRARRHGVRRGAAAPLRARTHGCDGPPRRHAAGRRGAAAGADRRAPGRPQRPPRAAAPAHPARRRRRMGPVHGARLRGRLPRARDRGGARRADLPDHRRRARRAHAGRARAGGGGRRGVRTAAPRRRRAAARRARWPAAARGRATRGRGGLPPARPQPAPDPARLPRRARARRALGRAHRDGLPRGLPHAGPRAGARRPHLPADRRRPGHADRRRARPRGSRGRRLRRGAAQAVRAHPAAGRRRTAARAGARPQGAQAEAAQGRARAGAPGGVQPPLRRLARAQADRRRRQGGPGDAEGRARDRQGPQGPRVPRDAAQALRHTRRRRAPARQPRAPRAAAVRGDRRRAPGRPDRHQHHGRHARAGQLPLPGTGGRLRRRRQPLQRRRPAALRRLPAPARAPPGRFGRADRARCRPQRQVRPLHPLPRGDRAGPQNHVHCAI